MKFRTKIKFCRKTALFMAYTLLFQTFFPAVSLALTSGPAQPEFKSFQPATASDMVDLFSGDFSYNIPLFELPGPNGGYPFNLAYNAGITTEQEASWVGLGWSLNPGAVSRTVRGLPDDFNNEKIVRKMDMKENKTWNFSGDLHLEIWGFDPKTDDDEEDQTVPCQDGSGGCLNLALNFSNNSYKGYAMGAGLGLNVNDESSSKYHYNYGLNYDFSSDGGASLQPSFGIEAIKAKSKDLFSLSSEINSREGLRNFSLGYSTAWSKDLANKLAVHSRKNLKDNMGAHNLGASFIPNGNSFPPAVKIPFEGFNFTGKVEPGAWTGVNSAGGSITVGFSRQQLKDKNEGVPTAYSSQAYGYMFMKNRGGNDDNAIIDFNREKEGPISDDSPNLGIPITTPDIYSISGQGTGGTYRAYRSDIGILTDPSVVSKSGGGTFGIEGNYGNGFDLGVDLGGNWSVSRTTKYSPTGYEVLNFDNDKLTPNYEPVYFKALGSASSEPTDYYADFGLESPVKLKKAEDLNRLKLEGNPKLELKGGGSEVITSSNNKRSDRKPRGSSVQHITNDQLLKNGVEILPEYQIEHYTNLNDFNTTASLNRQSHSSDLEHDNGSHIAGFTKIEENGFRYNYTLPVRNLTQSEVLFSTGTISCAAEPIVDPIPHTNEDIEYNTGDHYYDETITPEYSQSHLLTSVLGTDYIDSDGTPGPSDGDHGYWVKMNYFKPSDNMGWRAPYTGANYLEGRYSIEDDNKAGFTYGEREQFYLANVETKTHYAEFHLAEREDARGAASFLNDSGSGAPSYKLDKIKLYSKLDPSRPLKTVHFDYDYALCQGTLNSLNNGGKLTLKNVWFTYDNSERGRLSPYHFDYDESSLESNPSYAQFAFDRWGTYKNVGVATCNDMEFPYTEQDKTTADKNSASWNLRKITLPSGATIDVDYESDDYGHVQDRVAMQMFPISGVGPRLITNNRVKFDNNDLKVFFTPPSNYTVGSNRCSVKGFLEDLHGIKFDENSTDCAIQQGTAPQIFYKVYVDLLNQNILNLNDKDFEFVSGYAIVSDYGVENGSPYVQLKPVTQNNYHPFSLSAWQLLKLEFSSKLSKTSISDDIDETSFNEAFRSLRKGFLELGTVFESFYTTCNDREYGQKIDLTKSFIRLNVPSKVKYGGGCRVKKIQFNDNWNSNETVTYGQTYKYVNEDGTSSGVAINEPNTGYEECPLRYAKLYQEENLLKSDENFFFEYPINQSYYPSATVGYSKVEVKSLASDLKGSPNIPADIDFNYGTTGATIHEFYTAKDFPTIVNETSLSSSVAAPKWLPIGIGSVTTNKYTGTQGYSIILNDMHGKSYKKTHYAQKDDGSIILDQPVNQVVYSYHEGDKRVADFHNNRRSQRTLNNNVNVLMSHKAEPSNPNEAHIETQQLGVDYEFFTDINENSVDAGRVSVGLNVDFAGPWFFGLSGWPSVNSNNSRTRTAVTNKVIYKTGILKQTDAYNGQSHIVTNNEVFDPLTGTPLLTTVNNSFDENVYNYSVPAYLPYSSMGGAYENWGLQIQVLESAVNSASANCGSSHYISGISSSVKEKLIPGDEFIVLNDSGNAIDRGTYKFDDTNGTHFNFEDLQLSSGQEITLLLMRSGKRNQLNASAGNIVGLSNPTENWENKICTVPVSGQNAVTVNYKTKDDILSISANTFSDGWTLSERNECPNEQESDVYEDDEYFRGQKGIWKPKAAFTYVGNRSLEVQQLAGESLVKNLNESGKVDDVPLFEWENAFFADCSDAEDWKKASETVKCAKNGLENESKNILGIYSSAMYGYGDILPVAVAGNARYREVAFEGFETMASFLGKCDYASGNFTFTGGPSMQSSIVQNKTGNENYSILEGINSSSSYILTDKPYFTGIHDVGKEVYSKVELFLKSDKGETAFERIENFTISSYQSGGEQLIRIDFTSPLCHLKAQNTYTGDITFWYGCDLQSIPCLGGPDNLRNFTISGEAAHSGKKSLKILRNGEGPSGSSGLVYDFANIGNQHELSLIPNKKYVVSAWVHVLNYAKTHPSFDDGFLGVNIHTDQGSSVVRFPPSGEIIDGWQRIEGIFTMSGDMVYISLNSLEDNPSGNSTYYDDIRIYPLDGAMESYVYDTKNYRLKAKLDNNNYATFYSYDEEGNLTLIKKETEKGIKTIQEGRTYLNPNGHVR